MKTSNQTIDEIFSNAQTSLVLQQSDLSLQSVTDMIREEAIDISPKYQRRDRWSDQKNADLIESFLLNIPVPPIYLAEDDYGIYSVIDGKQRLTAISKFLNGQLALKNLRKFTEIEGCTFEQLPPKLANALKIRPYLRVVTLLRQSDSDLKHEVFLRLNKSGVALNAQEIRNVAYRGALNDLLFRLSENTYFATQLNIKRSNEAYKQMTDVQFALRFFTVQKFWENFPGSMDKAMDNFMEEHHKADSKTLNKMEESFNSSLEFCQKIWGKEGFKKPQANKKAIQGFFDIQMVCPTLLSRSQRARAIDNRDATKRALNDLLENDTVFFDSTTTFTSNKNHVRYRIQTFCDALKAI